MLRHKHIIYYTLKIVNSYIKLIKNKSTFHKFEFRLGCYEFSKKIPIPGVEPGPAGWKPAILAVRPYGIGYSIKNDIKTKSHYRIGS